MAKHIRNLISSIYQAVYLSIFLHFARILLQKVLPHKMATKLKRYLVIVTMSPYNAIVASFDTTDLVSECLEQLHSLGWGENVAYDTVEHKEIVSNEEEWRLCPAISIFAGSTDKFDMGESNFNELVSLASHYGQTRQSTTFRELEN